MERIVIEEPKRAIACLGVLLLVYDFEFIGEYPVFHVHDQFVDKVDLAVTAPVGHPAWELVKMPIQLPSSAILEGHFINGDHAETQARL